MAYKGKFRPINTYKYLGNPSNIIYRSLWECKLMSYLDKHPDVLKWNSEEVIIPYRSPIDGRKHKYYPDFYVQRRINGKIKESIIEVKPDIQTRPPKIQRSRTPTRKYLREVRAWGVNEAKWIAATEYCKDRGWDFKIMTEKELGIK
jgi:hypothetical protein|tara:strand:- start:838 stop:1278 length:441 start_codon:yes stop_codon:yes gene_type:complete